MPPWCEWLFEAFVALQVDRPVSGLGVSPIPSAAVDAYARRHGLGPRAAAVLLEVIPRADDVFRHALADKRKRSSPTSAARPGNAASRRSIGRR